MLYVKPNQMQCRELDFLESFQSTDFITKLNKNSDYEITILKEPYTSFGYADLVCIIWNKDILNKWTQNRNTLIKNDIKILHHLYNCKKLKDISNLVEELGFSQKKTTDSIQRLIEANLIRSNVRQKYKINPIHDIFFVKDIISIEAKLHDWNRALSQSINNTYFSSKSYTLFPEKIVTDNMLEKYSSTDVGIITFDEKYKEVKKPKRNKIPSSLRSWFFNEYIGREQWQSA